MLLAADVFQSLERETGESGGESTTENVRFLYLYMKWKTIP